MNKRIKKKYNAKHQYKYCIRVFVPKRNHSITIQRDIGYSRSFAYTVGLLYSKEEEMCCAEKYIQLVCKPRCSYIKPVVIYNPRIQTDIEYIEVFKDEETNQEEV